VPTLIWLFFFLKIDKDHPEPRRVIIGSFLFGSLSALFAIPFQGFVAKLAFLTPVLLIVLMATIEETVKYFSIRCSAITDVENNEPLDPLIYVITAALGFAAMENTLYLINFLNNFGLVTSFLEGSKRFVGATLLHVTASAFIGLMRSFSYYRPIVKQLMSVVGLALAIVFHSIFNLMVTHNPPLIIEAFTLVWITIFVIIILAFVAKRAVKKRLKRKSISVL